LNPNYDSDCLLATFAEGESTMKNKLIATEVRVRTAEVIVTRPKDRPSTPDHWEASVTFPSDIGRGSTTYHGFGQSRDLAIVDLRTHGVLVTKRGNLL
jgi:hypothetical protein